MIFLCLLLLTLLQNHVTQATVCSLVPPHNSFTHKCCANKLVPHSYSIFAGCCGDKVYNYGTERCCQGDIIRQQNGSYLHCCGADLFDPSKHVCCKHRFMHVNNYGASARCCGSLLYDPKRQVCCNNDKLYRCEKTRAAGTSASTSNLIGAAVDMFV